MSGLRRGIRSIKDSANPEWTCSKIIHLRTNGESRFARLTQNPFSGGAEDESINGASAMSAHYDKRRTSAMCQDWDRLERVSIKQNLFRVSPSSRKRLRCSR